MATMTTQANKIPAQTIGQHAVPLPQTSEGAGSKRFRDFDLAGGVFVVTDGARGLGLCMAEALVEAGGEVHCLDRLEKADAEFEHATKRVTPQCGGSLHYGQVDVRNTNKLDHVISKIASRHKRIDGLIAAAGIQHMELAVTYNAEEATKMLAVNYTGVFMTATAVARKIFEYKCRGSMCLIASMSGLVANKGLLSPVYNSTKAAVIQLARNLYMEWGKIKEDGTGRIRVNCLSPVRILTPMVEKNFEEVPGLKETWESENIMGRLSRPDEFKGAGLFLLSGASSFMTGQNLVIDGGHTAP